MIIHSRTLLRKLPDVCRRRSWEVLFVLRSMDWISGWGENNATRPAKLLWWFEISANGR
jgi:hypothetical protein